MWCRRSVVITFIIFNFVRALAASDTKASNPGVVFQAYSGGMWTPFGIMFGKTYTKGHGFYFNGRCNHHILKTTHYYFIGDHVNNTSLHWTYDGSKVYSRWEVNAGVVFKIFDNKKGVVLRCYAGLGVERPRYLYSFKKSQSKTVDHTWVEYKELGGYFINTEAGLTLKPNRNWFIMMGASTLHKKREIMMTFGIGKGL